MRGARSRNSDGSRVIHKSAGNWPRSMWSSHEIRSGVTIFSLGQKRYTEHSAAGSQPQAVTVGESGYFKPQRGHLISVSRFPLNDLDKIGVGVAREDADGMARRTSSACHRR